MIDLCNLSGYWDTHIRGHLIFLADGEWRYADTGELIKDVPQTKRSCTLCGQAPTEKDHDPCIADLVGVENACCGHGFVHEAYVHFEDDSVLRHEAALEYFAQVRAKDPLT